MLCIYIYIYTIYIYTHSICMCIYIYMYTYIMNFRFSFWDAFPPNHSPVCDQKTVIAILSAPCRAPWPKKGGSPSVSRGWLRAKLNNICSWDHRIIVVIRPIIVVIYGYCIYGYDDIYIYDHTGSSYTHHPEKYDGLRQLG